MPPSDFLHQTFSLQGHTALITGASSGIGAHTATTLARAGAKVILTARRLPQLQTLANQINAETTPETAHPIQMDVTDPQSIATALTHIAKKHAPIHILINNAGIAQSEKFLQMPETAWQQVLDTNLTAVWRVSQAVAQQMLTPAAPKPATIINIASVLGIAAQPTQTNYGAAKAGVIHLTKIMALELARHNIRVNAIAPGYFTTEMNRQFLQSPRGRTYIANLLPQRPGNLPELDGALLLLASPASTYINGITLTIDGGTILGNL